MASCISGDDLGGVAEVLAILSSRATDKQKEVVAQTDAIKVQVQKDLAQAITKAAIAMKKALKLAKNPFLKAFKWIAVIITAVIAALLIVASGGTATVVAASMMMGICALTVMSEISNEVAASKGDQEGGVIPSFDQICGMLCGVFARAAGASDEERQKAKTWGGLALSLFIQLGLGVVAMPSSAMGAVGQVTERAAEIGSHGFSSAAKSAIKNAGEMFGKIDVPAFQKLAQGLKKFVDETSDVQLLAKVLERSFYYLTAASLLSQTGDAIGTMTLAVAQKGLGDAEAEVASKEALLKWFNDQLAMAVEEAQESMQQTERIVQAGTNMVADITKTMMDNMSIGSSSARSI